MITKNPDTTTSESKELQTLNLLRSLTLLRKVEVDSRRRSVLQLLYYLPFSPKVNNLVVERLLLSTHGTHQTLADFHLASHLALLHYPRSAELSSAATQAKRHQTG